MIKKMSKKGFTLVELLAALVILGLLTAIAAPNVISIVQRTKLNTYVEDGIKLSTLAEYKFKGDTSITRPASGKCIVMSMSFLGTSEFKNPPYGGEYDPKKSFVVIRKNGNNYEYYVQIIEKKDSKYSGILALKKEEYKKDDVTTKVKTGMSNPTEIKDSAPTAITVGGSDCTITKRYYQ